MRVHQYNIIIEMWLLHKGLLPPRLLYDWESSREADQLWLLSRLIFIKVRSATVLETIVLNEDLPLTFLLMPRTSWTRL